MCEVCYRWPLALAQHWAYCCILFSLVPGEVKVALFQLSAGVHRQPNLFFAPCLTLRGQNLDKPLGFLLVGLWKCSKDGESHDSMNYK